MFCFWWFLLFSFSFLLEKKKVLGLDCGVLQEATTEMCVQPSDSMVTLMLKTECFIPQQIFCYNENKDFMLEWNWSKCIQPDSGMEDPSENTLLVLGDACGLTYTEWNKSFDEGFQSSTITHGASSMCMKSIEPVDNSYLYMTSDCLQGAANFNWRRVCMKLPSHWSSVVTTATFPVYYDTEIEVGCVDPSKFLFNGDIKVTCSAFLGQDEGFKYADKPTCILIPGCIFIRLKVIRFHKPAGEHVRPGLIVAMGDVNHTISVSTRALHSLMFS